MTMEDALKPIDVSEQAPYQLMPPLSNEEYQALKEDIRRRGVAVAIEFDGDGNVLDGHHRLRAWQELQDEDVDVPMYDQKVMHFTNEDAKRDYVLALNLKRRHLTPNQKAMLFARLRLPPYNMTIQAIADVAQSSVGTVWRSLEGLPDDVRESLDQVSSVGKDGKTYPAVYQTVERTIIPSEKAERDYAATNYGSAADQTKEILPQYLIVITLANETEQTEALTALAGLGYANIKAVIS